MEVRGLSVNNDALDTFIKNFAAREARARAKAGIDAMTELRAAAVGKWYNNGLGKLQTINFATECISTISQDTHRIYVEITSHVNLVRYNWMKSNAAEASSKYGGTPYTHALKWKERHEHPEKGYWTYMNSPTGVPRAPLSMPWSTVGEYLIHLQWEQGILGLPERETKTDTGWINPDKNIASKLKKPMRDYVRSAFTTVLWEKAVNKYLQQ